ncbi:MAG: tRNA pseudouridine(13) synthase TruD [Gammaproteobacteria bacterium]|jgi:tRNA pseudouridine13 synthase
MTQTWPFHLTGLPPITQARLRTTPEDFVVDEVLGHEPNGEGEHVWLHLRKQGINTDRLGGMLARIAQVPRRAVSHAGLKDRHAVTSQWFGVHLPGKADPDWVAELPGNVTLLEAKRHGQKLRTGALRANRFRIVLRDCMGDAGALDTRLQAIRTNGVPNYFGEQRFGHGMSNVQAARDLFAGIRKLRDKHLRGIFLSAARSWIFNHILDRRVQDGTWDRAVSGDAFVLAGTHSFFVPEEVDEAIEQRLRAFDIHPSGALWGRGELPTYGAVRELELEVAESEADLAQGLEAAGMKQERRALRLVPEGLSHAWLDDTSLQLEFTLPAGCYATSVLRELAGYTDSALATGD